MASKTVKHVTNDELRDLFKSIDGKTEHPANSNRIFVWYQLIKWKLALSWVLGQPYCAGGIVWTLRKLRLPIPDVANPWYCPSRLQWYRAHGRFHRVGGHVGDEVFFAFSASAQASGLAEHVGRLVKQWKPGDRYIYTFEFNTSSGNYGSQDNGGGCFFRRRPVDSTVLGTGFWSDHFIKGAKSKVKTRLKPNPWAKALRAHKGKIALGDSGPEVRGVQWAVGIPVDGEFGPQTDHAVRHFQRYHTDAHGNQLVTDGEVGRLTREALLKVKHPKH